MSNLHDLGKLQSEIDLREEAKVLLGQLHAIPESGFESGTKVSKSLAKFASLQVVLAEQAEKTSREVVDLTKELVRLTKALKILTIVLLLVSFVTVAVMVAEDVIANHEHVKASQNEPAQGQLQQTTQH